MDTRPDEVMARAIEAVAALARRVPVSAAFIFGSQVDGQATEHSDIDIAVFARGVETWGLLEHARAASRVQAEVGDDIELHIFPDVQLEHPEPASFAAYVQKHGVRMDVTAVGRVAEEEPEYGDGDAQA